MVFSFIHIMHLMIIYIIKNKLRDFIIFLGVILYFSCGVSQVLEPNRSFTLNTDFDIFNFNGRDCFIGPK